MATTNLTDYISSFFELISYVLLTGGLMGEKRIKFSRLPVFLITFIIQYLLCFNYIPAPYEFIKFFIQTLSMLLPAYIYFHDELGRFLFSSVTSYIILCLIQVLFSLIAAFIPVSPDADLITIAACIFTLVATVLLVFLANLGKLYSNFFEHKKPVYLILGNLLLIIVICTFYAKLNFNSFLNLIVYFSIALALLVLFNMIIYNQFFIITKKSKELDAYNEYMPVLEELIQSVRSRQHNHINELQAIRGLMYTHTDYESLTTAMATTLERAFNNNPPSYLLRLNLPLVSGFLLQKEKYARNINRNIEYDFKTYTLNTVVPEYELVELFGILIDNALEAIPPGDTVYVSIGSFDNRVEFTTRNSGHILTNNELTDFFRHGYSKKEYSTDGRKHSGIGLFTLRKVVLFDYKGDITLCNKGTDIVFQILV